MSTAEQVKTTPVRSGEATGVTAWWSNSRTFLGESWDYTFASERGLRLRVVSTPKNAFDMDQPVWLAIDPSQIVRVDDAPGGD